MNRNNESPHERLRRTLRENGEPDADSLAEVGRLMQSLQSLRAPDTRSEHQKQLLAMLSAHLPRRKTRWERFTEWYPVALLMSQTRVIKAEILIASAVVLVLGVLVTLMQPAGQATDMAQLTLSALAPIVAAVGVALLYDTDIEQMLELEQTTRASARVLLLARLTLVFGFNLAVALGGSAVLAVFRAEVLLIPLISAWLAPMTFLVGLAFFLSVVLANTFASMSFSLFLWLVHLLFRRVESGSASLLDALIGLASMPGLLDPANRPLLMGVGAVLVLVALGLVGTLERQGDTFA
jgi:hypothetical protein